MNLSSQTHQFQIGQDEKGMRLDVYLVSQLGSSFSRTYLQRLIEEKNILVNGAAVRSNYHLKPGDAVQFSLLSPTRGETLEAEAIPLHILFEDDFILVVDKPAGLVVHPGAGNPRHTLVNALLHRVPELVGLQPIRPGIVHRLDKETSGVMVVAKNQQAYLQLGRQFRTHSIKRVYLAFVKGSLSLDEDEVQLSIGRHPRDRKRFAVSYLQGGRAAITRYRVLKRFPRYTYVELAPKTGRTHQLRVHMAFLGHPILGDSKYGSGKDFTRLALHAHILGLLHPQSSRYLEFKSLLPLELKKLLE